VCALALFFTIANKLRNDLENTTTLPGNAGNRENATQPIAVSSLPAAPSQQHLRLLQNSLVLRVAAVLALASIFGVDVFHEHQVYAREAVQTLPAMPAHIGNFSLQRSWNETAGGVLVYTWGEYAAPAANGTPGPHVMLGVSPQTIHDAEVCHLARGDDPTWHGQIVAATAGGPVELTAATYNNGAVQELEASTVCDNGACRQHSETSQHLTLIYARPHRGVPLQADTTRPIPLMLKVESLDTMTPARVMEPQLAATLTTFLKDADLLTLTRPYGKR
jgi:exosortase J